MGCAASTTQTTSKPAISQDVIVNPKAAACKVTTAKLKNAMLNAKLQLEKANESFLLQTKKASKEQKRADQWKEAAKVAWHSMKQVFDRAITAEQEIDMICKELQDLKDCCLMEMDATLSNEKGMLFMVSHGNHCWDQQPSLIKHVVVINRFWVQNLSWQWVVYPIDRGLSAPKTLQQYNSFWIFFWCWVADFLHS